MYKNLEKDRNKIEIELVGEKYLFLRNTSLLNKGRLNFYYK